MSECSILFIDDDEIDHRLYRYYMSLYADEGTHATYAPTVAHAVEELQEREFDLVFVDHRMPPFNDFRETVSVLKPFVRAATVYVITGSPLDKRFNDALAYGAAGVIEKHAMRDTFRPGFVDRLRVISEPKPKPTSH
ncbi:MAG: response regulator [Pseudomonadota bacterium]